MIRGRVATSGPAAAVVAVALLAGCAATVDGKQLSVQSAPSSSTSSPTSRPPSSAPVPTPTPTPSPSPTPAISDSAWRSLRDAPTGVRFRLPTTPITRTSSGHTPGGLPVQSRDYLTVADGGVDVSVVITSGRNVVFDNLKVLPSTLVTSLQKAGRRNVRITGVSSTKVKGRPALSFHVSYTPAGTLSDPPIWFYTAIDDGSALVVVQTIDLPDAGTTAARLPRDRRLNQLLIDDVVPS